MSEWRIGRTDGASYLADTGERVHYAYPPGVNAIDRIAFTGSLAVERAQDFVDAQNEIARLSREVEELKLIREGAANLYAYLLDRNWAAYGGSAFRGRQEERDRLMSYLREHFGGTHQDVEAFAWPREQQLSREVERLQSAIARVEAERDEARDSVRELLGF